jgi:hypothetical protein
VATSIPPPPPPPVASVASSRQQPQQQQQPFAGRGALRRALASAGRGTGGAL